MKNEITKAMTNEEISGLMDYMNGLDVFSMNMEELEEVVLGYFNRDITVEDGYKMLNGFLRESLNKCANREIGDVVKTLYSMIHIHPMTRVFEDQVAKIEKPTTISEYGRNLELLDKVHSSARKVAIKKIGTAFSEEFIERDDELDRFIKETIKICNQANYLKYLSDKYSKIDKKYLKNVSSVVNSVLVSLHNIGENIDCFGQFNIKFINDFEDILDNYNQFYDVISEMIEGVSLDLDLLSSAKKNETKEEKKPVNKTSIVAVKNEKEEERLNTIARVNDLYERFMADCMRDLQKEVSMVNRDAYNLLMDKLEKFLKQFPMPLSKDVSLGMAKEAMGQVNKFYDMFTEISYNTYNPNTPVSFE